MEFGFLIRGDAEFDVVGFGLNAVDHLCVMPEEPEYGAKLPIDTFKLAPGGQAASAMVQCSRLGLRAKYVGKVGGDEIGSFSLQSIESAGVDVSDAIVVQGVTNQLAMIVIDGRTGERTILWHRPDEIATVPSEMTPEKVCVGSVLLLDGHDAPAAARAAELAREHGVLVVLDAETVKDGTAELVANTDLLVASSRFPSLFTGEENPALALSLISEAGPPFVAMTLGESGAAALASDGSLIVSPGFEVGVEDTTGAGDIFHVAFIYGLLQDWSVERTLTFSNAAAALNCTALGARGGIAGLEEIEALIKRDGRL